MQEKKSKGYKVVVSKALSKSPYDPRFVVVDSETGAILDDAQGYGFKTAQKAHMAWAYKTRDRSKDAEKAAKEKEIRRWCKDHKRFMRDLEDLAFRIAKGSYGPRDEFNTATVRAALNESGFTDLPFTPAELMRYIRKNGF